MRSIWIIAANTFREVIRDRILYGILVFALFLIGISLALGNLSFAEQARISANFGFTGIQLGVSILAVFVGSSLVAKEIDKQTILTLLARPITRAQFLLGKFLGLFMVIATVMVGLAAVLMCVVVFLELKIVPSFFIALLGVLIEGLMLIALALFFGTFSRPIMTVLFTSSLFIIGHWVKSLDYFTEKSESPAFKAMGKVISHVVPDLERFNWRSAPIYGSSIPAQEVLSALVYGAGWMILILSVTVLIFRRRDFV